MPKIKNAKELDYSRKNIISIRMNPFLLRYFTEKTDGKPGTRTKAMERSMRVGEEMEPVMEQVEELLACNPVIAEGLVKGTSSWRAGNEPMPPADEMTMGYIVEAVKAKIAADKAATIV